MTKASLGNSPASAIPCSLWNIFPRTTIGFWSAVQNLVFILIQIVTERGSANKIEVLLQVIVALTFGFVVDMCMKMLYPLQPAQYLFRLMILLLGTVAIAFGSWWEIMADVVMLPGDAIVRMYTRRTEKEYGKVKMTLDAVLTGIAFLLSIVFLHRLVGVREGTLMTVVLTGNLIRLITGLLNHSALTKALLELR